MNLTSATSPGLHRLAVVILAVGVLLVWWGAAVTTKDVGLAVPDWPLCYRKINPEGWWRVMALMLEHGHRWLATIVYWLLFAFFSWQWFRRGRGTAQWLEWTVVLCVLMAVIALTAIAASPFQRQPALFWPAGLLGLALFVWLVHGLSTRAWPGLLKVSAITLLTVELQAVLGGMRVTEMSDAFAIVHACLGQIFYCLLLVLALMSSQKWGLAPRGLPASARTRLLGISSVLLAAVVLQLVWGASLRHLHRIGLPAPDVITTNGRFFPGVADPATFFFFLHKVWALGVTLLAVMLAWRSHYDLAAGPETRPLRRLPVIVLGLLAAQITLGVLVVLTHTSFWVTNFHVLNGLAILACVCGFVLKVVAAAPQAGMVPAAPALPVPAA